MRWALVWIRKAKYIGGSLCGALAHHPKPLRRTIEVGRLSVDVLMRAGTARLIVASQPLDAGQTEEDWVAGYFRAYLGDQACADDLKSSPRIPIDGRSGYLYNAGCKVSADESISPRDVQFTAFVFAGGRVYQIGLDGDVDLGYFEALLATVKLDPASAIDPPSPS